MEQREKEELEGYGEIITGESRYEQAIYNPDNDDEYYWMDRPIEALLEPEEVAFHTRLEEGDK